MNTSALSEPTAPAGTFWDYLFLTKPRLVSLVLATTLLGFLLGTDSPPDIFLLFHALFGSFLMGAGSIALNQFFEKDVDAKMKRTESRALPSGKLNARNVLAFGVTLAGLGFSELVVFVNPLTGVLGGVTFFTYVFFYTPLKRVTPFNTFVGAVPGALPIVMGWTAVRGVWDLEATLLFLILFVWQLPHFLAIAWVYREDYAKSGLLMLPNFDPSGKRTGRQIIFYSALLLPVSLLPVWTGLCGVLYLCAALLAGGIFLIMAIFLSLRQMDNAKKFVLASIYYLTFIVFSMLADKL